MPAFQFTSNATSTSITSKEVRTTCMPPPRKISFLILPSFSRLNSRPIVKSSKITPISAVDSTSSLFVTKPVRFGLINTPATRNPIIGTKPRRWQMYAAVALTTTITTISARNGGADPARTTSRFSICNHDHE